MRLVFLHLLHTGNFSSENGTFKQSRVVVLGQPDEDDIYEVQRIQTEANVSDLVEKCLRHNIADEEFSKAVHAFAEVIEALEVEYQNISGRRYGSFDEDLRHSGCFKIGWALDVVNQHEEFLDVLSVKLTSSRRPSRENREVQTAICRALVAMCLGVNPHIVALCVNETGIIDLQLKLYRKRNPRFDHTRLVSLLVACSTGAFKTV